MPYDQAIFRAQVNPQALRVSMVILGKGDEPLFGETVLGPLNNGMKNGMPVVYGIMLTYFGQRTMAMHYLRRRLREDPELASHAHAFYVGLFERDQLVVEVYEELGENHESAPRIGTRQHQHAH